MTIEGHEYSVLMGSDVDRDGMFLELYRGSETNGSPIAELCYSELGRTFALTVYDRTTPTAALDWLRMEGARRLPSSEHTA